MLGHTSKAPTAPTFSSVILPSISSSQSASSSLDVVVEQAPEIAPRSASRVSAQAGEIELTGNTQHRCHTAFDTCEIVERVGIPAESLSTITMFARALSTAGRIDSMQVCSKDPRLRVGITIVTP